MFPDITRDNVFRLETRRLWLRWPSGSDAQPPSGAAGTGRDTTPEAATGDPYRAPAPLGLGTADMLTRLATENTAGRALHFVLTGRGPDRVPFGRLGLTPIRGRIEDCGLLLQVWLDEVRCGDGLMTEAVQAAVDAVFMLTDAPLVAASARVLDPAFRRVLEKCGFAYCGTGLDPAADGAGLMASDRFRLDRKAWTSLKAWRVPGIVRDRVRLDTAEPAPCGG